MRALAMLTLLVLPAMAVAAARGGRFEVLPGAGGIHVHVAKRGLFSAFAHDHDFEVTRWHGTAEVPEGDPARASVQVALAADSLRDREKGLSGGDRRKVDAQAAGPDVLDAAHAPEIRYRSERVTVDAAPGAQAGSVRGTIHGELTLRGRTRPADATFEAQRDAGGWRVRGRARFRQSEFGIKPFSGFGGTVAVKDEVEVTFELLVQPGPATRAAAPGDGGEGAPSSR